MYKVNKAQSIPLSSEASWMDDLNTDDISDYADPTSRVKQHEAFIKYNASVAATKVPRKKWNHFVKSIPMLLGLYLQNWTYLRLYYLSSSSEKKPYFIDIYFHRTPFP